MCERARSRKPFGKALAEQGVVMEWIADSRMEIDQARLLTMAAAEKMDAEGNKAAQKEIAMIKVVAPNMLQKVLDRAIQTHGGAGVSQDFFLARAWTYARTMRIFDGPDEVHRRHVARLELKNNGS
jgi:acyl-CoA dehydrogenase